VTVTTTAGTPGDGAYPAALDTLARVLRGTARRHRIS
jgi:hypothetical protein